MSLLTVCGFDTDQLMWPGNVTGSPANVVPSTGRTGGSSMRTTQTIASTNTDGWVFPYTATASTLYCGFAFKTTAFPTSTQGYWAGIWASLGTAATRLPDTFDRLSLGITTSGLLQVKRGRSYDGTTLATASAGALRANEWSYIEIQWSINDTTGVCNVWNNGVQVISISNSDTQYSSASHDAVWLGHLDMTGTHYAYFDDFYLLNTSGSTCNTRLGDLVIETLYPNGNGNSSQWVGSDSNSTDNYQLIDESTISTADYVGSSTSTNKDTYAYGNLARTAGTVHGVAINSYAAKTDAGTSDFKHVSRSSTTEVDSAAISPATGYAGYQSFQETDPNGGGAWSVTTVNAAEFGVKRV